MELPPPIKIPLEKEVCTFINVLEIFIEWIKNVQVSGKIVFVDGSGNFWFRPDDHEEKLQAATEELKTLKFTQSKL